MFLKYFNQSEHHRNHDFNVAESFSEILLLQLNLNTRVFPFIQGQEAYKHLLKVKWTERDVTLCFSCFQEFLKTFNSTSLANVFVDQMSCVGSVGSPVEFSKTPLQEQF